MVIRTSILIAILLFAGVFFIVEHLKLVSVPSYGMGSLSTVFASTDEEEGSIIFVGDVMLARAVETFMDEVSPSYPFEGISNILEGADVTVGNFEATVPKEHKKTSDFEMQFSVREPALAQLANAGFDTFSLSNNHALDFGEIALQNTKEICPLYNLKCLGHPKDVDLYSIAYVDLNETKVGMFMLNTVGVDLDKIALGALLSKMTFYSDVQIVFVHWGEEYQKKHGAEQEKLAYALIDNGADAIIGHHPHVVQDIEIYKDKPIFYSLGNFIFDQYFSNEVQEGLVIKTNVFNEFIQYDLLPVTSIGSESQPRPMNETEREEFLMRLSKNSNEKVAEAILSGTFVISR